jgi:HAMP domain-containing protein
MGLRLKFNLVLVVVFLAGFAAAGFVSRELLQENARDEVIRDARLMMEAATAVRAYTVDQIRPHLIKQLDEVFLPQTVPAFAATQTINTLRKKYTEYSYKEATLNPTNPRDRATDWEADIVQRFRNDAATREATGVRDTPLGRILFMARPIRVEAGCLGCHSLPSVAPATMIARYGSDNGFGWQPDEIVGAQIVSVPLASAESSASHIRRSVLIAVAATFAGMLLTVNAALYLLVIRPVRAIVRIADRVSLGDAPAAEFPTGGGPEVTALAAAFTRMRKSLDKALRMLDS